MTKEQWIQHMVDSGASRPSLGGDKAKWQETIDYHKAIGCKACKARMTTKRNSANATAREEAYRSCGLHKVIGDVTGHVYWE